MRQSPVFVLLFCISTVLATVEVATKCPDGWQWFKRSRGGWCMKVYDGAMSQKDAEAKCKTVGATLSGVQNREEMKWMGDELIAISGKNGRIWIGLHRTDQCMAGGLTATCTALSSFYWTDGSTVGVSGFKWGAGEPNNMNGQACGIVWAADQKMDDMGCEKSETEALVCGKIATF